jgi:hypothetical protein
MVSAQGRSADVVLDATDVLLPFLQECRRPWPAAAAGAAPVRRVGPVQHTLRVCSSSRKAGKVWAAYIRRSRLCTFQSCVVADPLEAA